MRLAMAGDSDWKPLLDEFARREAAAQAMGGASKRVRQRDGARLDARQRIAALLDADTFGETEPVAGIGNRP